ncbi:unnamed protein product [Caenorhabditis brenneri]
MWTNEAEQEFILTKPHKVAELWGAATGNPTMNYDKMSRALRNFYQNGIIGKMPGRTSEYKFLNHSNHSSPEPRGQNRSLPSSPTSSASSAGSTSPIAVPLLVPMLPGLFPTNLAQMAQLTQNLMQFNIFKIQFPFVQAMPIPAQIQAFFNMKNAFPAMYPPAVLPDEIIAAAPIL